MDIEALLPNPMKVDVWWEPENAVVENEPPNTLTILINVLEPRVIGLASQRLLAQGIVEPNDHNSEIIMCELSRAARAVTDFYKAAIDEAYEINSQGEEKAPTNPIQVLGNVSIQDLSLRQAPNSDLNSSVQHAILRGRNGCHIQPVVLPALAPIATTVTAFTAIAIFQVYLSYNVAKQKQLKGRDLTIPELEAINRSALIPGAGFIDLDKYNNPVEATPPQTDAPKENTMEARQQDIEQRVAPNLTEEEIQALLDKGRAPYKDSDRTEAGRAIDKHGMRPGSTFPAPKGSAEDVNRQGIEEMEKILRHPDVKVQPNSKGGEDYVLPDGKGFRIDGSGEFDALLEPE